MRRLLAILLLAAFGLPTVAPLLAQAQDPNQNLPACCRRNGAHHCMMGNMRPADKSATITALCPSFPHQATIAPHLNLTGLLAAPPFLALPLASPSAATRAETQRRLSRERTRQTRGPPAAAMAA